MLNKDSVREKCNNIRGGNHKRHSKPAELIPKQRRKEIKKYWKKIGMLILIIACVFNVMNKLVHKLSLNKEMLQSAQYVYNEKNTNTQK